ncbi:MAG: hypothetical protein ACK4MS_14975, partial [Paracoccaceae bacterium]
ASLAGVAPEGFTQVQLIQLLDAQRTNDDARIRLILSQAGQSAVSRSDMGAIEASGNEQLAALAGVAPGLYTSNELQRLIRAQRTGDDALANFILTGQNRAAENPASAVTPGQVQLAALLGVDASDYTLSELTQMHADRFND